MELGFKNSAVIAYVAKRMHDPVKLRWMVTGVLCAFAGLIIYLPLASRADDIERNYLHEKKRLALVKDIDRLREDYKAIKSRMPAKSDASEWAAYITKSLSDEKESTFLKERKGPFHFVKIENQSTKTMAPYRLVSMSVIVEGCYEEFDRFLRWLDSNERLLRVDNMKMEIGDRGDSLIMRVVIVGLLE